MCMLYNVHKQYLLCTHLVLGSLYTTGSGGYVQKV